MHVHMYYAIQQPQNHKFDETLKKLTLRHSAGLEKFVFGKGTRSRISCGKHCRDRQHSQRYLRDTGQLYCTRLHQNHDS